MPISIANPKKNLVIFVIYKNNLFISAEKDKMPSEQKQTLFCDWVKTPRKKAKTARCAPSLQFYVRCGQNLPKTLPK